MIPKKDIALFEEISTQFQQVHQINPLASKIYTYILFDVEQVGVTFEEMIAFFKVSKSSVSTSLQLLLHLKLIDFCNKFNDRKRYFKINSQYLEFKLQNTLDFMTKEKELSMKFKDYKQKRAAKKKVDTSRLDIYIDHLTEASKQLTNTLEKFKKQP